MLNVEWSCNSAVPFPSICPREMNACPHKNLYVNVHSSNIHNNQKEEAMPVKDKGQAKVISPYNIMHS
jgi:hypothetical protein